MTTHQIAEELGLHHGQLFIVSAPSGTGKTTLVERLVRNVDHLVMSRSYTSRPPRGDEVNGVDYNFVRRSRFEEMAAAGQFLEWAEVFGNLYGTSAADTVRCLRSGQDLVLVIDVQGARQVLQALQALQVEMRGVPVVAVFVLPPSFEVLERRLRGRSNDDEAAIRRRLEVARQEVSAYEGYDYVVVNDEVDACVDRLRGVVIAERAKLPRMHGATTEILKTFAPLTKDQELRTKNVRTLEP
jgi:guanylate kinase